MRRGQITAFLIIGLLLVLAGVVLYYTGVIQMQLRREAITYPEGAQPVAHYVESCITQAGTQGVRLLGQQGGWIAFPAMIANEPTSYLSLDELNLRQVPFWHFKGKTRVPTLRGMETQLNAYVQEETLHCLQNFTDFEDRYIIEPQGPIVVDSTIAEDDVFIQARYPLRITQRRDELQFDIDTYQSTIDARLKQVYELASALLEHEVQSQALGNLTISFLAMDPEIPMDGLFLDCGSRQWLVDDLKTRLQAVLTENLPRIRVRNTDHPPFEAPAYTYTRLRQVREAMHEEMFSSEKTLALEDTSNFPEQTPSDVFAYHNMYFDVGSDDEGLQATYTYTPEYGMHFLVSPSKHDILRSSDVRGQGMMQLLCMQQYHYLYDISYPVHVRVHDPASFDGAGYTLAFAMPVVVDDNQARLQRRTYNIFEDLVEDETFCRGGGDIQYDIRAAGIADGLVGASLDDVNISSVCAGRVCELGQTRARGGIYRLLTRLPAGCANPFLRAEKAGYLPDVEQIDESTRQVELSLTKLKTMNVEVVKHQYYEATGKLHGAEALEGENVSIYIRIPEHDDDQHLLYPQDKTIELIDGTGTYEMTALLHGRDTILGGYHNANLTLTFADIEGMDTITFHVFEYHPRPFDEETQQDMMLHLLQEDKLLHPTFT